jgi:hypothetical protein
VIGGGSGRVSAAVEKMKHPKKAIKTVNIGPYCISPEGEFLGNPSYEKRMD